LVSVNYSRKTQLFKDEIITTDPIKTRIQGIIEDKPDPALVKFAESWEETKPPPARVGIINIIAKTIIMVPTIAINILDRSLAKIFHSGFDPYETMETMNPNINIIMDKRPIFTPALTNIVETPGIFGTITEINKKTITRKKKSDNFIKAKTP
jgi:hypothetical protein